MCVSYSHGCAVNWIVLFERPSRLQLVLRQVEQRVTHLLLINADDGVSHGKHLYHIRGDPAPQEENGAGFVWLCD